MDGYFKDDAYRAMNIFFRDGLTTRSDTSDFYDDSDRGSNNGYDGNNNGRRKRSLVKILVELLQYQNDELRMTSAQLLFDMHKRESILFSDALESYLVTDQSITDYYDMVLLGSMRDSEKLLVKMHRGKLGADRENLLAKLQEIASACLLKNDLSEPNTCYQEIVYSSSELFSHVHCNTQSWRADESLLNVWHEKKLHNFLSRPVG